MIFGEWENFVVWEKLNASGIFFGIAHSSSFSKVIKRVFIICIFNQKSRYFSCWSVFWPAILNHQFIHPVLVPHLLYSTNCMSRDLQYLYIYTSFALEIAFSTILLQKIIILFDIHPKRCTNIIANCSTIQYTTLVSSQLWINILNWIFHQKCPGVSANNS